MWTTQNPRLSPYFQKMTVITVKLMSKSISSMLSTLRFLKTLRNLTHLTSSSLTLRRNMASSWLTTKISHIGPSQTTKKPGATKENPSFSSTIISLKCLAMVLQKLSLCAISTKLSRLLLAYSGSAIKTAWKIRFTSVWDDWTYSTTILTNFQCVPRPLKDSVLSTQITFNCTAATTTEWTATFCLTA